jgi:CBS domain.
MLKARDVMTTDLETCSLLDNVYEAAVKMKNYDIGAVPIVDGGKLVGIVTDRDLVIRGIAEKRPGSTPVKEVMTDRPVTASPGTPVEELAKLMAEHQIRRVPIVEGGRPVGIVSLGDLATEKFADERAGEALKDISEPVGKENYLN